MICARLSAAGGPGGRAAGPPAHPDPGRADRRPGSEPDPRDARDDPRAGAGAGRAAVDAHPVRRRGAGQPGGDHRSRSGEGGRNAGGAAREDAGGVAGRGVREGDLVSAVIAIVRREWEAYFRTPAGWAVMALFLTLQGIVFWMFLRLLASPDAPPGGVMEFFFGGTMMYWIAAALLVTVAPMRLVADELRAGTIEPLLTAPVTAAQVVIGKWLAAVAFFATVWVPTLAYVVYLRAAAAAPDAGPIAAGYLGTFLIGAAALAIGLLASSLTRYQLVAAPIRNVPR